MNFFGINLTTSDLWLLSVAGVCLAWLVPHRLSIGRDVRNRRAAASVIFNKTVLDILTGLYPIPSDWPSDGNAVDRKLQSIFPALQIAVASFRESLPRRKQTEFDKAWTIYLHGSDGIDRSHYYQYMGYISPDKVIPDSKITFHNNVSRLLSYAQRA